MKIKDFRGFLKEFPSDATLSLSTLLAADVKTKEEEVYEVILDFPIIGLAFNEEDNEVRLVVSTSKDDRWLKKFGSVLPFKGDEDDSKEIRT